MALEAKMSDLQQHKYQYKNYRDDGDAPYTGKLDRDRVDKDEAYEVLYFINQFMDDYNVNEYSMIKKIEDALHSYDLSHESYRPSLNVAVHDKLLAYL
ncbi:hypothetical protein ACFO0O_14230 [Cobetia amphilecti]|uniref:Uncharacterized protein n=1 Tax=Cobetia amphilecti TaxID=1055104 RepID=A0ABT6UUI0_9GAMM|nr:MULTISPECIES: hypothetical protein [Cobetia]AOM00872.1 hypothetical protein BFX80_05630 [Cobetia marina]MCK8068074.1 hypothetical protein [Cobetia sp. 1CM21F]MDI5886086.1 hypothetical protein [Cobetia amphilecti]